MNLANDIAFLLYKHNCVIVPELGAFLVNEKPAELNTTAKYASPKQRAVSFNEQIQNNDGLLANQIASSRNMSYEDGMVSIKSYVEQLKTKLSENKNVELSEIGTFYRTDEGKLIFVPYHTVNFSLDSFGLPKLRLKTLEKPVEVSKQPEIAKQPVVSVRSKPVEKKIEQQEKRRQSKAPKQKRRTSNLSIVNVLGSFFLIGMFFALLNFELNTNSGAAFDQNYASILDTPTVVDDSDSHQASIDTQDEKPLFTLFEICTEDILSLEEAETLRSELIGKYAQAQIQKNENGSYHVSIISFSNEGLAHEYMDLIQNRITQQLFINTK